MPSTGGWNRVEQKIRDAIFDVLLLLWAELLQIAPECLQCLYAGEARHRRLPAQQGEQFVGRCDRFADLRRSVGVVLRNRND